MHIYLFRFVFVHVNTLEIPYVKPNILVYVYYAFVFVLIINLQRLFPSLSPYTNIIQQLLVAYQILCCLLESQGRCKLNISSVLMHREHVDNNDIDKSE